MGTATYGGKGLKGRDSGKWREANRRRQLQTSTPQVPLGNQPVVHTSVSRQTRQPLSPSQLTLFRFKIAFSPSEMWPGYHIFFHNICIPEESFRA